VAAAKALGSQDRRAVKPLILALSDKSRSVKRRPPSGVLDLGGDSCRFKLARPKGIKPFVFLWVE
jgi:hypothetical protein